MKNVAKGSSSRAKAAFSLAAVAAGAVLGVGAALAHDGGFVDQEATRGFGGISNVNHGPVPAGTWTFKVVGMDGKVMDLTLAIKSECVGGTFYFYEQIKKPKLNLEVAAPEIPAHETNLCSQVGFPGAGKSITVRVSHPS